ncbi:MAG: hypothetical protein JXQ23_08405 [Clostridia bacterium]|nr:hypothetical protein [Clostridia bacterium]
MDYFKDRVNLLREIEKNRDNKEFISKLLDLIEDMATMLDDCVDGIDDLDDRLQDIENSGE